MNSVTLIVICLAAIVGGSASVPSAVEWDYGSEGGKLRLYVDENELTYSQEQKTVMLETAQTIARDVTEYLRTLSADDFKDTIVGRSVAKYRLKRKLKDLGKKFCHLIKETPLTSEHVQRFIDGLAIPLNILSNSKSKNSKPKSTKFSSSEFEERVLFIIEKAILELEDDEKLVTTKIKFNGKKLEDWGQEYISLFESKSFGPMLDHLGSSLSKLLAQISYCMPK